MARIDELHNYAYPDSYLDELHTYDKSLGKNNDEIHFYGNRGVTYGLDEMHLYGSYQTEETVEDEINKPKERELIDIDKYFDEIEAIDEEQKEERKELAVEFRDILKLIFMLILADLRVGNEINEGFYLSLAKSRFMDAIDSKMPYLTIDIQTKIENYIHQNLTYVIEATMRHTDDAYYFSEVRATAIAVDDSMATYNLDELDEAIKAGYKYKIWKAMDDNRVRLDHQKVDGKKVEIDKPFEVGRCLMQAPMIFDENSHFQDAKQIINCRCTLIYSNKGDDVSGKTDDDVLSSTKDHKRIDNLKNDDTIYSRGSIPMNLQFFSEKDLKSQGIIQLKKGIKNLSKRIVEHREKISNPSKFIDNWDEYSPEHKERLLNHWEKEIENFNQGIEDRTNEIKSRE